MRPIAGETNKRTVEQKSRQHLHKGYLTNMYTFTTLGTRDVSVVRASHNASEQKYCHRGGRQERKSILAHDSKQHIR